MVRDYAENPGRKEHRDVAEVGNVDFSLVSRKYTGNNQVVGTSNQRKKAYARGTCLRAMEAR